MPKIMETLRSICFYIIDRSTQSSDSEALEGRLSTGRIPQFYLILNFSSFSQLKLQSSDIVDWLIS